jgi:hypothetical protein
MLHRTLAAAALAAALPLAAAAGANAHGGPHARLAAAETPDVRLRGCRMTVALVPRPAAALRRAFPSPPDLTRTFYGSDPLLALWVLSCERAQVEGAPARRATLSLVAVPTGLTDPAAVPLANAFAHRLLRVDTSSRPLAHALRHRGLPARRAVGMRYAHSPEGRVPATATAAVAGQYRLEVAASALDRPHDHRNAFEHRAPGRRPATLALTTAGANDRFCFPAAGGCSASVAATPGSQLARLLGARRATPRVAFDHLRITRIDLVAR